MLATVVEASLMRYRQCFRVSCAESEDGVRRRGLNYGRFPQSSRRVGENFGGNAERVIYRQ